MSTENKVHPFTELSGLIDLYKSKKNSFDVKELQTIREDISLSLFYLSDSASQALANYEESEHIRKMRMAEREQFHRNNTDDEGKRITVSEAQNLARVDCRNEVENCKIALRQKERVRIIISATSQILNSISSRLSQLSKH
jgi:flagellar basal body P-ring protein FlgI